MTLLETQRLFHAAITGAAPPAGLRACFADTPGLAAEDGVALYAGMYRARLGEALRETFPALARHLGEARFAALAGDYLTRHPSAHHDVGQVGRSLPAFLRRHPAPDRPDLCDLAALEWARQRAFFAPPSSAAGPSAFAALAPTAFASARLRLSPALHLLALGHDVAPAWRALSAGEAAGPARPGAVRVAVWRRGFEVFHAALAAEEAEALRRARAGAGLGEVCEPFAAGADPAEAARAALAGWLGEGWISAVVPARRPRRAGPAGRRAPRAQRAG